MRSNLDITYFRREFAQLAKSYTKRPAIFLGSSALGTVAKSDGARVAWSRRYSTSRAVLKRNDPEPFKLGRLLGKGGWGDVPETDLDGTVVALKRVYFRDTARERPRYTNELGILEKLSGKRHRHIVELIGCYELPSQRFYQLGLLIWPVAQCDLSAYLGYLDTLQKSTVFRTANKHTVLLEIFHEEKDALDEICRLLGISLETSTSDRCNSLEERLPEIYERSRRYLYTIFGCLASATAYLHNDQTIRHKDIKPSQVRPSSNGLWLTDCGWSLDISELSNSATDNSATVSARYHAPERVTRGERYCGRPEDVFWLGCVYLEMINRVCEVPSGNVSAWQGKGFL